MCSSDLKKNLKDLSVRRKDDGLVYNCHHCGANGFYSTENKLSAVPTVHFDLQAKHLDFLASRGISKETANKAKLFSSEKWFHRLNAVAPCIAFPYYKDGKMVGAKYRSITGKDFTQDVGGNQVFWGIDNLVAGQPVVIVEGEIDALSAVMQRKVSFTGSLPRLLGNAAAAKALVACAQRVPTYFPDYPNG